MTTSKPKKKGTQVWMFTYVMKDEKGSYKVKNANDGEEAHDHARDNLIKEHGGFYFTGAFRLK